MSKVEIPTDIKQVYERLIVSHDKALDHDETIKRDIETSRTFQDTFCCDNPAYIEQINVIKAQKSNIITNNTVGAYLFACFQPELAVEIACTPACAEGLKNPDIEPCELASYKKSNGKLIKVNTLISEDANIFIEGDESLNQADKTTLQKDGVKIISIYTQDGTSINYILGESINISETPTEAPTQTPTQQETTTNNWAWVWIIAVIILIIIIALILART